MASTSVSRVPSLPLSVNALVLSYVRSHTGLYWKCARRHFGQDNKLHSRTEGFGALRNGKGKNLLQFSGNVFEHNIVYRGSSLRMFLVLVIIFLINSFFFRLFQLSAVCQCIQDGTRIYHSFPLSTWQRVFHQYCRMVIGRYSNPVHIIQLLIQSMPDSSLRRY